MNFLENLEKESSLTKSLTENLAVAYKTSGDALLDFNFRITDLRYCKETEIISSFKKIFYKDKVLAIKYLFYVGDIREGLGERNIFKTCISWLSYSNPIYAKKVIKLIPIYSRWDILIELIKIKSVRTYVTLIIKKQLKEDLTNLASNKSISLLGKWLPSENTSSKETRNLAQLVIKQLNMSPRAYRKTLSKLRAYLNVVEVKMSNKEWDKIDYEYVPSKANLIYSDAFLRNDPERRREYLEDLVNNRTRINSSILQPHEIINKYIKSHHSYDESLEQMWKALPYIDTLNTLVVRDGSGSMLSRISNTSSISALDVASALAIYCSEHTKGIFKDKFITFSREPRLVNLSYCDSLFEKIDLTFEEADISNTNIYKTMMLILHTAKNNNMTQEELPDTVLIISDMQFDGISFNLTESLFDTIKKKFENYGYKLPRICFWNLCPYNSKTIPLQINELGVILCSGFSINNIKMFMSGEIDPLKILLETINSERYELVEKALI